MFAVAVFIISRVPHNTVPAAGLPINRIHGMMMFDTSDTAKLTGDVDYVFVGRVESIDGTEYKFPVSIETETGIKEVSTPYTNYGVQILSNIKGSLPLATIPVQKAGGISQDGSGYIVYEDDFVPKQGDICVFYVYTQQDGSLCSIRFKFKFKQTHCVAGCVFTRRGSAKLFCI